MFHIALTPPTLTLCTGVRVTCLCGVDISSWRESMDSWYEFLHELGSYDCSRRLDSCYEIFANYMEICKLYANLPGDVTCGLILTMKNEV